MYDEIDFERENMKNTTIPNIDLKALRKDLGLTQKQFCEKYHLHLSVLKEWEQGRREPHLSAKLLLFLISKIPEKVGPFTSEVRHLI